MLLLKAASPLTVTPFIVEAPVTSKLPLALISVPSIAPSKVYLSLPENVAALSFTDIVKSPPSTSFPSVSNCLIIISPSV
nr:MAG TPA: hypothetical protein [Caudoviricetes sp.]